MSRVICFFVCLFFFHIVATFVSFCIVIFYSKHLVAPKTVHSVAWSQVLYAHEAEFVVLPAECHNSWGPPTQSGCRWKRRGAAEEDPISGGEEGLSWPSIAILSRCIWCHIFNSVLSVGISCSQDCLPINDWFTSFCWLGLSSLELKWKCFAASAKAEGRCNHPWETCEFYLLMSWNCTNSTNCNGMWWHHPVVVL